MRIVALNGGLGKAAGNSAALLLELQKYLPATEVEVITLAEMLDMHALTAVMKQADGFILVTGTYWQSWGSPMQRFLEAATLWEGTDIWLGKPAAVLVTMHSVGGLEVMSRLVANLNMFGAYVPPMCGMVYSYMTHLMEQELDDHPLADDIWSLECLETLGHNLLTALHGRRDYKSWDVSRGETVVRRWLTP